MTGINTYKTPDTSNEKSFPKQLALYIALLGGCLTGGCGNVPNNEKSYSEAKKYDSIPKTEQHDSIPKAEQHDSIKNNYCEVVDPIQVIKEGDDGKKYIDDIYHYPIIEKDGKQYLIYNNTEYKLENCQRINDNNQEFYILGLKKGGDLYYLADDKIHKGEIISDMGKTTDGKIYFTITDFETQKETFVFNGKEVGKLDHISKVYWDRAEKLLFVFGNDYDEEGNITYKLITNNSEHKIDYPYELIDLNGKFFDENVSLEFYKEYFTLMNQ